MYGDQVTFGQAVIVCLFSLAVVFAVLLAISFLIDLTAWVIRKAEGKPDPKPAPSSAPTAPAQETAPAAPERDDGIDAVLVSAAVAAYLGQSVDQFTVRSIRRIRPEESAWSQVSRTGFTQ